VIIIFWRGRRKDIKQIDISTTLTFSYKESNKEDRTVCLVFLVHLFVEWDCSGATNTYALYCRGLGAILMAGFFDNKSTLDAILRVV
jgi:hypothetical protein